MEDDLVYRRLKETNEILDEEASEEDEDSEETVSVTFEDRNEDGPCLSSNSTKTSNKSDTPMYFN